ncbi:MAG TPA: hypothetical protein VF913_12760 [Xanthobacteraceae bacterium]
MKFWARNQGKGWGPVWICLGFMLAHADALAANDAPAIAAKDEPPCLSLKEVHDGYPRYRVVEGRRCWYASTRGPEAKPAEVDVNPYDDPIWNEPDAGTASAATRAKTCEEQALKLDLKEKRSFMKQCMAN